MITVLRSAQVNQGASGQEVFEWSVKVAIFLNKNWGTDTKVHSIFGGNVFQVNWITTYDSLAHLEELSQKFESDPAYISMINEARDASYFRTDSVCDTVFRAVH